MEQLPATTDPSDPGRPKPAATPFAPVAAAERISSVDVLRGVAVLGILGMNIYAFAMPFAAYGNPTVFGGFTGADFGTWIVTHLLFEQKFMTVFSMLFGAGLVLMAERAEARGSRFLGVYYRRTLWLLLLGLIHAYLIWFGDILFFYALCGLLLYPLRRLAPKTLLIVGSVMLVIPMLCSSGLGLAIDYLRGTAEEAEQLIAAGETPSEFQREMLEQWQEARKEMSPTPEQIQEQVEIHRGGYFGILLARIPQLLMMQTVMFAIFAFWRIEALMLIGAALMKLGVFSARRSADFYVACVLLGYGVGLPLAGYSAYALTSHGFDVVYMFRIGGHFNYVGSLFVALGHVGVVMLVCKTGLISGLRDRLAAVGRMALTNYLMHSLLLTLVFYGYGLGLFGRFDRFAQMGFVVAIWILQLAVSPWWLARYRYGPAEWLWRSLTYSRRQPMRAAGAP